jgi:hypothetical protein
MVRQRHIAMRNTLIFLCLCFSLTISGATYYVSPGGSDSNNGTISQPWKSPNYAFNKLVAGDILYVRGGTYTSMGSGNRGIAIKSRNGTSSSPIKVFAYSGETPVLDCSGLSASNGDVIGLEISNCSYWTIAGLDIKNVSEPTSHDGPGPGCAISGCSNITFDQVNVHDCGNGFITYVSDYIYYKNCDSYQNADQKDNGDLANGFYTRVTGGGHVFYDGCRAWLNSDDGWDAFCPVKGGDGYISYNKCWAFENGAWGGKVGNGCGFKTGVTNVAAIGGVQRTLTNCLAFNNSGAGYDESQDLAYGYSIPHVIYNCVSYNNVVGFDFDSQAGNLGSFNADIIKNCISYQDGRTSWKNFPNNILSNNWFQAGGFDDYFASLDASQAKGNRQADGSLPVMTFLHLTTSAIPLLDAGADVGIAFAGNSPDIGAFEMLTGSNTVPSSNMHPIILISNPRKGNVFENLTTITIDAIAYDPDGNITKVEIFNGAVKLVELTTTPYTFTWKDVVAGSYSLTAIATDNSADTTISAPVEFVVGPKVKYDANSDIIKLYPNPNDGHFSIAFINPLQNEKSDIEITDMAGKQVYNGTVKKEETLKKIDLSDSKSGIYIMIIKDKEILVTKKFIKK